MPAVQSHTVLASLLDPAVISPAGYDDREDPFVTESGIFLHDTRFNEAAHATVNKDILAHKCRIYHSYNTRHVVVSVTMDTQDDQFASTCVYWTPDAPLLSEFYRSSKKTITKQDAALLKIIFDLSSASNHASFTTAVQILAKTRQGYIPSRGRITSKWAYTDIQKGVSVHTNATYIAIALSDLSIAASILANSLLRSANIPTHCAVMRVPNVEEAAYKRLERLDKQKLTLIANGGMMTCTVTYLFKKKESTTAASAAAAVSDHEQEVHRDAEPNAASASASATEGEEESDDDSDDASPQGLPDNADASRESNA